MSLKRLSLAACALALLCPGAALAVPFDVFVEINTEEDLDDLRASDQIDEDTYQTLLELYQRGVNLDTATREELYSLPNLTYQDVDAILAYRDIAGYIDDPAVLVGTGVLTEEKLFGIAAFLVTRDRRRTLYATDGWVRVQTRANTADDRLPPSALQARVSTLDHLTIGLAATVTRNRVSDVVYDPNRGALSAQAPSATVQVPKVYAEWKADGYHAVAGSYRIGFGQSLTFDNTTRPVAAGIITDEAIFRDARLSRTCRESQGELPASPCAGEAGSVYGTPDYRWRDGLFGVAVGLERLPLERGWLQARGFVSRQARPLYQYQVWDREACGDPSSGESCSAPHVYRRDDDDPLAPTSRFSFQTLPDMFRETLGGGNVTYNLDRRTRIGVTGYGAAIHWLTPGMDLDFQRWARLPYGGPFGAVGTDLAWGHKWADVFLEVAHSFDSMDDGGGGLGAVARGVATWDRNVVEASLRYYEAAFANPYARPIAAPDLRDGLRARDEAGARLRYTGRPTRQINIRANADVWMEPSSRTPKTLMYVRTDVDATRKIRWGLWGRYQNRNLRAVSDQECALGLVDVDLDAAVVCGRGRVFQAIGRLRYAFDRQWSLAGQYQHELRDDDRYDERMRQDVSAWAVLAGQLAPELRLRARVRYLFRDISDNSYLEQSLWSYLDLTYRVRRRDRVRVRYDVFMWLDDRASTAARTPSPEHWLWLEYESRF